MVQLETRKEITEYLKTANRFDPLLGEFDVESI